MPHAPLNPPQSTVAASPVQAVVCRSDALAPLPGSAPPRAAGGGSAGQSGGAATRLLPADRRASARVALPWQRLAPPEHAVLGQLVDGMVIPQLLARVRPGHALLRGAAPVRAGFLARAPVPALAPVPVHDGRLATLVRALVAADPAAAFALLQTMQAEAGALQWACLAVLEPAARGLGDLWASDDCTDVEVTVGLGRLQHAFRQLCTSTRHRPAQPAEWAPRRSVLVAPQPGEPHLLGAVLDAELLLRAGFEVHCEFPADDAALNALVAGTWFDAIDLTLSMVYPRAQWRARMANSVAALRHASLNPALAVVVGGRAFHDPAPAGLGRFLVGADAQSQGAAEVAQTLHRALQHG